MTAHTVSQCLHLESALYLLTYYYTILYIVFVHHIYCLSFSPSPSYSYAYSLYCTAVEYLSLTTRTAVYVSVSGMNLETIAALHSVTWTPTFTLMPPLLLDWITN